MITYLFVFHMHVYYACTNIVYASRVPPTRFVVCVLVGRVDEFTCDANGLRVSGSLGGKVGELG